MNTDIKDINIHEDKQLVELVYGDSVPGDTMIQTIDGGYKIEDLFGLGSFTTIAKDPEKEYVFSRHKILISSGEYKSAFIIRHKTSKSKWKLRDSRDNVVYMTGDHSMIIKNGFNLEIKKPCDVKKHDKLVCYNPKYDEIIESEVHEIIQIGHFDDEYVYDISIKDMDEDYHNFFANNILIHNTDSLYMSYDGLLSTVEGVENMSVREKTELIVGINREFLDPHNKEFMDEYYKTRHCESAQLFELETVNLAGIWLNVKKRYAQILTWKDGKYFDEDSLPMKVKGLEIIKSSYPALARKELKQLVRDLIEIEDPHITHIMNQKIQAAKERWYQAPVEAISQSKSANNYSKYILDDNNQIGVQVAPKCPAHVRGLAEYNRIRNIKGFRSEPCYGGKIKFYVIQSSNKHKNIPNPMFAFPAGEYPSWADQFAPVDRDAQFQACVLDPFNRILSAMELPELDINGNLQLSLF